MAVALGCVAPGAVPAMGYRPIAAQAVRIDMVERIARAVHDARDAASPRAPFVLDPALAVSIGLEPGTIARLMAELGFRPAPDSEGVTRYVWRGRGRASAPSVRPAPDNAFAALADWGRS